MPATPAASRTANPPHARTQCRSSCRRDRGRGDRPSIRRIRPSTASKASNANTGRTLSPILIQTGYLPKQAPMTHGGDGSQLRRWVRPVQGNTCFVGWLPEAARQRLKCRSLRRLSLAQASACSCSVRRGGCNARLIHRAISPSEIPVRPTGQWTHLSSVSGGWASRSASVAALEPSVWVRTACSTTRVHWSRGAALAGGRWGHDRGTGTGRRSTHIP